MDDYFTDGGFAVCAHATLLPNGKVLVAGGKPDLPSDSGACELYNPGTRSWSVAASLPQPLAAATATMLPNGQVLVAGGANSAAPLRNVETYQPTTGKWSEVCPLNIARSLHTATLLTDGKVLVTGGDYALGDPSFVMASAELLTYTKGTAIKGPTEVDPPPEPASEPEVPPKPILPGVD